MEVEKVRAANYSGFSCTLLMLVGVGPKFTIECGKCHHVFKQRIIVMDYPEVICPACRAVNVIPVVINND